MLQQVAPEVIDELKVCCLSRSYPPILTVAYRRPNASARSRKPLCTGNVHPGLPPKRARRRRRERPRLRRPKRTRSRLAPDAWRLALRRKSRSARNENVHANSDASSEKNVITKGKSARRGQYHFNEPLLLDLNCHIVPLPPCQSLAFAARCSRVATTRRAAYERQTGPWTASSAGCVALIWCVSFTVVLFSS